MFLVCGVSIELDTRIDARGTTDVLNVSYESDVQVESSDDWNSFASSKTFLDREDLRTSLSACYGIPRVFWTPVCQESNGFFGSEDIYNVDGDVEGHGNIMF